MLNIAQDEHVTVALNTVVQVGERFGVVRHLDNAADDGRTVYVELYTQLDSGRYFWSGVWFAPEQLTPRPDVAAPSVILNAMDSNMAAFDAEELSHARLQQERTLYWVNGY